ncbi:MAG: ATP-binding protein, partial [Lachnospiraceae bacterium]|nr:ATP-binding protein [Lachnospiraceae bacterium]
MFSNEIQLEKQTDKLELLAVDYNFLELLNNINSMFQSIAQKKNLEFQFQLEGEIPLYLYGDAIRLRQVLIILCGNAVKFTEQGFVCLMVMGNNDSITLTVTDTGIGLSEDNLKMIYNLFSQVDTGKIRGIKGTGFGLFICKQIIEMMGGNIEVISEYRQGSAFIVTIPKIIGNAVDSTKKRKSQAREALRAYRSNINR